MIYLVLHIILGSSFVLLIKWVQQRQHEDVVTVGCLNYIVAMVAGGVWYLADRCDSLEINAVWTGAGMGACYFTAYFFVVYAIRYVGVAASSVVGVLSIMMPIGFGILIWHEQPNIFQFIGIVIALIALLMIGDTKTEEGNREQRRWFTPFLLISFFLLAGFARLSQEAFKYESVPEQKPTFLLVAFAVASIPSVAFLIYRRRKISWIELLAGIAMGMSNILQSFFLLRALDSFEGFIVFPVASAGGLVFITLYATIIFQEKLRVKSYLGISLAAVALVLLNWGG